jgi:hypothetical protein
MVENTGESMVPFLDYDDLSSDSGYNSEQS